MALIVVALGLTCIAPSLAFADATSHVKGTVTAKATGLPLAGVSVMTYTYSGSMWVSAVGGTTNATGQYDIVGVPNGPCRVVFSTTGYLDEIYLAKPRDLMNEYYNAKTIVDVGTSITITSGGTVSGVDGSLAKSGCIMGTVLDSKTGLPVSGVQVAAFRYWNGAWTWEWNRIALTDAAGRYTLSNLSATSYRVNFQDAGGGYVMQAYAGASSVAMGTSVAVSEGTTSTGIDVALVPTAHIVGDLTNALTGMPLASASVTVYQNQAGSWNAIRTVNADVLGHYDVGGLVPGTYRLGFSLIGFVSEYFEDALSVTSARNVDVTPGGTAVASASLAPIPHVSGRVTSKFTGQPITGVTAYAYRYIDGSWGGVHGVTTNANGEYDFADLSAGTYRLKFSSSGYVLQYYDGKSVFADATTITVGFADVTGLDVVMVPWSHVKGKVTSAATSLPVSSATVGAYRLSGGSWTLVGSPVGTDAQGMYDLAFLPAGTYRIGVTHDVGHYAPRYYNNVEDIAHAVDITVGEGQTVSSVNVTLLPESRISGTVTDRSGAPLESVRADPYRWDGTKWVPASNGSYRYTNALGRFTMYYLAAGTYRIVFTDIVGTYATESFGGGADVAGGSDVVASVGATTTGADISLSRKSNVAGTVRDASSGSPIPGAYVTLYRSKGATWTAWTKTSTSGSGSYDATGLPGGYAYRVGASDPSGTYLPKFYAGKADVLTADDVTPAEGGGVAGIDVSLILPRASPPQRRRQPSWYSTGGSKRP